MQVLVYALCFFLAGLGVGCLSLLGWVVWPARALAAREVLEVARGRCLLVGLLHLVALLAMMKVAQNQQAGSSAMTVLLLGWVLWQLLAALPGALAWLGESVGSLADRPHLDTARATLWGALVLAGTGLIPWLGWALVLASLSAACGSGFLSRRSAKAPSPSKFADPAGK